MSAIVAVSACPVVEGMSREPVRPSPETLAYSFTLPSDLTSPGVARAMTRSILQRHELADLTDPAVQVDR